MKFDIRFFLQIVPLSGAMLCGLIGCTRPGVLVTVTNAMTTEITALEVKFKGGTKLFQKLKGGETFTVKVNASNSSHLVILFRDASGNAHSSDIDVYFEPGYKGSIDITILPDGKVIWKDKIKIGPHP